MGSVAAVCRAAQMAPVAFCGTSQSYQTLGKGVVWSLKRSIAFWMNSSREGVSGLSEGLVIGSLGDESCGVSVFEDSGKVSFDVIIISFRFKQREGVPASNSHWLQYISLINDR